MTPSVPTIERYMTRAVHFIDYEARLTEAHEAIERYQIRHLPVLHRGKLVGILSERDLYWSESMRRRGGDEIAVSEAMTPLPYAVGPEAPLAEVAREMAQHRYGAAVIMKDGQVLGVFTTTDALRALADHLEGKLHTP